MRCQPGDVLAAEPHGTILRRIDARDQVEQRGLARPIGTDDRENQPERNAEADVAHGAHAAEGDRQTLDLESRHVRIRPKTAAIPWTMPCRRKIMKPITTTPSTICSYSWSSVSICGNTTSSVAPTNEPTTE